MGNGLIDVIATPAKYITTPRQRYLLRAHLRVLRERGPRQWTQQNVLFTQACAKRWLHRSAYQWLDERQLAATRTSDVVFVFGSGYSLNDISPLGWQHIARHNTFGFTAFAYQQWVRVDYHLIRGGLEHKLNARRYAEDFCRVLNGNSRFDDACIIAQGEYRAMFANQILGERLLTPGRRVYRYRTAGEDAVPTTSLRKGVQHNAGTLGDAINIAACLGWKHIVLAGVDLYDSRYFWLAPDETLEYDPVTELLKPGKINVAGLQAHERHHTARTGVIQRMAVWRRHLETREIQLTVLNPRSLLADVMPVYRIPE